MDMIPDLTIRSKGGTQTDIYSGDVKLLDVYSLNITATAGGSLVVASACQPFTYEGPATLRVDAAFKNAMKSDRVRRPFPEERVTDVRIQFDTKGRYPKVTLAESGEWIEGVTTVSLNLAYRVNDVVVSYVPPPERRGDQ